MSNVVYINSKANEVLHSLRRVFSIVSEEIFEEPTLFLPDDIEFEFLINNNLRLITNRMDIDKRPLDLINIIRIDDALNLKYTKTNILTSLAYAESMKDVPWHITTQGLIFVKADDELLKWVTCMEGKAAYGKHEYDVLWLPFSKTIDSVTEGEIINICNRRVGGWDGSHSNPVIELLGAGGHLPVIWNERDDSFRQLTFKENINKELKEELGIDVEQGDVIVFGGYTNLVTHELVVLCGLVITTDQVKKIYDYSIQNIDDDTAGIYLGTFPEIINAYRSDPTHFAGGRKSSSCNFPNNSYLMDRVINQLKQISNNPQINIE